nr:uncharacterized protein LOC109421291 [Aedes albopictus]
MYVSTRFSSQHWHKVTPLKGTIRISCLLRHHKLHFTFQNSTSTAIAVFNFEMDINLLPTELLQEIMSYLCFETLKVASLVCHRWHQVSESFIIRNGQLLITESAANDLNVIRNCVRNYRVIWIARMEEWSKLQTVMAECIQRFPNIRKLYLSGCLQDYLYRFYNAHRNWVEQCESFQVSLDDRFADHMICGPEDFELTLPNLKTLMWSECLYGNGQKAITINAPKLESIYINDSLDASAVVRIPNCDNIKFIRCIFYTKHFDDTFVGNVSNVETLMVDVVYANCDISYLVSMLQLRYLRLRFGSATNALKDVESMHQCHQLKVLSITIQDANSEKGELKLDRVLRNFNNLQTLDLRAIDLKVNSSVQATKLEFLKLRDVTCSSSAVSLHLPSLKVLSVSVNILSKLQFNECSHFEELYLDLESAHLKQSLVHTAIPFILSHKSLKKLVLFRSNYQANRIVDSAKYECKDLGLEHLELYYLDISIDFFRMISYWKSLRRLTIVACSINCRAIPYSIVHLPGVQWITLDCVKPRGPSRKEFPLTFGRDCELQCVSVSSALLYSTQHQLDSHHRRFDPFACDEIDPLH